MTFTPETKKELAAPLARANVKSRQQGGRSVSYIEGWKAIEEANRIFGFDGWVRETLDIKCVTEHVREIGAQKQPGWGVSYTAKVRIIACGIIREGIGAGHGIDRDLGQAHESAIKEAETDAMKRAMMTFGNPFGLALYDKEQVNVEDHQSPHKEPAKPVNLDTTYKALETGIRSCNTLQALKAWASKTENKKDRAALSLPLREKIDLEYGDKLAALQS